MGRLRSFVPIVIAAVVIIVAAAQFHSLDQFLVRGDDTHPCRSLYDPAALGTDAAGTDQSSLKASITTILAVESPNNLNPTLHSLIMAQATHTTDGSHADILSLLKTFPDKSVAAGAPNWSVLDSFLEYYDGDNNDM